MAIVYRLEKGSPLTWAETDENFRTLAEGQDLTFTNGLTKDEDGNVKLGGDYEGNIIIGDVINNGASVYLDKDAGTLLLIAGSFMTDKALFSLSNSGDKKTIGIQIEKSGVGNSGIRISDDTDSEVGIILYDNIFNKGLIGESVFTISDPKAYVQKDYVDKKNYLVSPDGSKWYIQNDGTFSKTLTD